MSQKGVSICETDSLLLAVRSGACPSERLGAFTFRTSRQVDKKRQVAQSPIEEVRLNMYCVPRPRVVARYSSRLNVQSRSY